MQIQYSKNTFVSLRKSLLVYGVAVSAALVSISLVIALLGFNVPAALRTLVTTSFKSSFGLQETLKKTVTLIFTTYAFSIPFRIKFFNIGGMGQMLVGGTAAAVVGLSLAGFNLPFIVLAPLMISAGIVAGALYAFIAGYLQARHNINPIISTIMLNFVALLLVNFVSTTDPWRDPIEGHPMTKVLPAAGRLPFFFRGVPASIIFAAGAVILVYIFMKKSKPGFEINAVGYNLHAAQTYGINFFKTILLTFLLAGGLAGLGGALEVMNIHGKLIEGFELTSGAQYGIFGILTSLICAGEPLGVPIAALFMAVMLVGADALQRTMQIPVEAVFLTQALMVILLVVMRQRMGRK